MLTGKEEFTDDGISTGLTVTDFWSFQFSNILSDPDEIAEFLVAKALGLEKPYNKDQWTHFDILYRDKRIEVKQTAYYHPFNKPGKLSSVRRFGIQRVKGRDGRYRRENDVYVFCLLKGEDEKTAWPLELSHWEFYVVPTLIISGNFNDQKTVSLSKIRELTEPVSFSGIKEAVDAVLYMLINKNHPDYQKMQMEFNKLMDERNEAIANVKAYEVRKIDKGYAYEVDRLAERYWYLYEPAGDVCPIDISNITIEDLLKLK